ncbi:SIMPL domain-containing protein [Litorisediminicola beolgyonensis]|uniref:SIMPL domain-containing protein n=1 Tax=Litorisediminicola beolgyonensis TaxID=1173614 RepID=A0ABW3ZK88_9RHOB
MPLRHAFPVALLALTPVAAAAQETDATLSLTGTGTVSAPPDVAQITMGVTTQDETASGAMNAASEAAAAILTRLEAFGVSPQDMQTSGLDLGPIWVDRTTMPAGGSGEIAGYRASNRVTARIRDLDNLSEVLGGVLDGGANTLQGLSFDVANPDPLLDEARRMAVADATARAETIAKAAGVSLGRIRSISENGGGGRPVAMAEMRMMADAVPVAAGETGYSVSVSITWEIEQE